MKVNRLIFKILILEVGYEDESLNWPYGFITNETSKIRFACELRLIFKFSYKNLN